ncbi:C-C chemokine receptor type 7 [Protobothrops mucrosquamatus]|uniref:C-C chemokine receptor type 7 n=1 Tax=Protobothrops mucrosquamatus TaxID=103944 RepID=UPI0010FB008C|nr:C-C chemokine receptor type 7 [Protobothrops mucrosquamatus]
MDRDQQLKAALFWKLPLLFQEVRIIPTLTPTSLPDLHQCHAFCKGDFVINSNSSFDEDVTKESQVTLDYIIEDFSNLDYSQFEEMCKKDEIRKFRAIFLPVAYSLICFVGLAGNGLVMATYIYFKRLKTMTDIYLFNLALSDIFFLLTLPFWAVSAAKHWIFGDFACKAIYLICQMSFFSGMLLLLSISIDRYFAIVQATSAHRLRSQRMFASKVTCFLIWTLAFIFSVPEVVHTSVYEHPLYPPQCFITTGDHIALTISIRVSQMVFGFCLPLFVMTFCYCVIIRNLLQPHSFEKKHVIKILVVVMIAFVLLQLPYNCIIVLRTISKYNRTTGQCDAIKTLDVANDVTYSLACFRCCLNPFLYAFIGIKFRNDVLRLLKDLGCINQKQLWQWSTNQKNSRSSVPTETDTTTSFSP